MRRRFPLGVILLSVLLPLGGAGLLQAQEEGFRPPTFSPGDVLPLFFRSLQVADLFLFENGSVANGLIKQEEFTLFSPTLGEKALRREEIIAILFDHSEGAEGKASVQVFLASGDRLVGQFDSEKLNAELVLTQQATLDLRKVQAILFKLPPPEKRRRINPRVLRQLFGVFNPLLISVTRYDTLVLPDGRLASVLLEDRDELAFTIDSPIFGTFTFKAPQIAWVLFSPTAQQPDQLTLQNGDRVSGSVTAHHDLKGTLTLFEDEFLIRSDEVHEKLRQIMFKIPVRLFGGGRPGPPPKPSEGD